MAGLIEARTLVQNGHERRDMDGSVGFLLLFGLPSGGVLLGFLG
jgi:hypothetical protein